MEIWSVRLNKMEILFSNSLINTNLRLHLFDFYESFGEKISMGIKRLLRTIFNNSFK